MALPNTNGIFIHNGINCSPPVVPTAQSIPMSPSDPTTVKTAVDNKSDLSIIADEYDTSATYTLGDFVIYDKVLYKCIMHSTTGDWDSTRWVAVNSKDSGINLKNSSGNTLVKIWEDILGRGTISLYDKTTGYETVSLYGSGYVDAKSITVMTSGQSNSGRITLTTTQSNSGYISLRDDNKNTPIELNADDGNINAVSLNGVTIGSSPKFTDTTYTFANGTNGFTVTPSGGTAQTVTVTPSITNNVTGSGTTNYIPKFTGTNTIGNGYQTTTSVTSGSASLVTSGGVFTALSSKAGVLSFPSGSSIRAKLVDTSIKAGLYVANTMYASDNPAGAYVSFTLISKAQDAGGYSTIYAFVQCHLYSCLVGATVPSSLTFTFVV